MKIGIDAKFASPRYGGLGTYTIAIIKALVDLDRDDIVAFAPEGWGYDLHLPPTSERFAVRTIAADGRAPADFFAFRVHWEQTILPTALERHASPPAACSAHSSYSPRVRTYAHISVRLLARFPLLQTGEERERVTQGCKPRKKPAACGGLRFRQGSRVSPARISLRQW